MKQSLKEILLLKTGPKIAGLNQNFELDYFERFVQFNSYIPDGSFN